MPWRARRRGQRMADRSFDWAALYHAHRDAMYGVAFEVLRGTGRVDLAADAVHNAFVSLIQSPPNEPPRSWEGLLVATAKRRALDIVGSAATARRADYVEENVPASVSDEDAVLERLQKIARARPVIARLPERERMVLEQYIASDRPRSEVAAELGVSPARVSQLARSVLEKINAATQKGA